MQLSVACMGKNSPGERTSKLIRGARGSSNILPKKTTNVRVILSRITSEEILSFSRSTLSYTFIVRRNADCLTIMADQKFKEGLPANAVYAKLSMFLRVNDCIMTF
uniref:Uncharacterized protein n=1 Tax=Romanomermis culicivorax TaxID=13658 RepID=A0A915JXD7_ROMCU